MGYNTVAVLYNDHDFDRPDMGKRIKNAMRGWSYRDREPLVKNFGAGMVVSQAHADYTQIVAVGRNNGKPIADCNDLDSFALQQMAECLIRHGWTAKPPKRNATKRQGADA